MAKILLIEDEEALGGMLTGFLSSAGHEVKHVLSAEDALKAGDFAADLLLVDHGLPGKKGIDALPDLKKIFSFSKIVILSNFDQKDYMERAKANGADGFWMKIKATQKLSELVKEILEDTKTNSFEIFPQKI